MQVCAGVRVLVGASAMVAGNYLGRFVLGKRGRASTITRGLDVPGLFEHALQSSCAAIRFICLRWSRVNVGRAALKVMSD